MTGIYPIDSLEQFKRIIYRDTPVIVFFYVPKWSSPCEKIAPTYEAFSAMPEYNSWLAFCKVDCESQPDIASINGPYPIANVPTFILYHRGVELGRVVGSDKPALRDLLNRNISQGSSSYSSSNSRGVRPTPPYGWS
ncbi:hypothetical protein CVT26_009045 [Gymnopilus dilepis]|uniref:Thioredoxin domain-containing protein n=1 Tax=Gymnopilus dilepis TaxID=231916 RepID=A0A409YB23_9AGAR|nr:hypothetical protein CVT26_009045 [Gymnopilus dilepis]